jgi:hypothetical protein
MAKKSGGSFDQSGEIPFSFIDITELLVHVPPRGRRTAILTVRSETGVHEVRADLSSQDVMDIANIVRKSAHPD